MRMHPALLLLPLLAFSVPASGDWPQFRGPGADGHAPPGSNPPIVWSESENIAWKVETPGEGWSSPVVVDKKIWITAGFAEERRLHAQAFDPRTGELLHDVEVFQPDAWQAHHPENTYASPTPVGESRSDAASQTADRARIWVHFGAYGTACLDADTGEVLWRSTELAIDHEMGPGSSPIVYKDLLIVNYDGMDRRFVAAYRKETGEIAWTSDRSLKLDKKGPHRKAYSTPIVVQHEGAAQLISPAADQVSAYDPATGTEIWRVRYDGYSVIPQPSAAFGMAFVVTGYMKPRLLGIRLDGRGDVTETHVEWDYYWQVPANPSPLLIDDRMFFVSDQGRSTWFDVQQGTDLWRQRLRGTLFRASPLYVAGGDEESKGRIYVLAVDGTTYVLNVGEVYDLAATNRLEGEFRATPAIDGDAIIVRSRSSLYRIEETTPAP